MSVRTSNRSTGALSSSESTLKARNTTAGADNRISEKDWRQVVVDYARLRGWLVYFTWRSIHSPAGYPDLCLVRAGTTFPRLVYAELKTERGRLRPEQVTWLEMLALVPGVEAYVWRPSQWTDVRDLLL